MILAEIKIKKIKQAIHGLMPYLITIILFNMGEEFKAIIAGILYTLFAFYVYFFVKKEKDLTVFGILIMLYAVLISGWGDF